MGKFSEYIGSQFGNPRGLTGTVCCFIMNTINKAMYKRTVALLELPKGAAVLDIGYGKGVTGDKALSKTGRLLL